MTGAEISHKLALAIGWPERSIFTHCDGSIKVMAECGEYRFFSHTDPAVIWPIAKHYKCFPYCSQFDRPERQWAAFLGKKVYEAATPEMAVALAVIGVSK